jgi:tyrosyl-tRNA synthetase
METQQSDIDKKVELITRNTQEIIGEEDIKSILAKRDFKVYLGTATSGKPHVGYFVPMMKIADFLKAGCKVTLLLADLHSHLDDQKTPWELLDHRVEYYKQVLSALLKVVGADLEKLTFVRGTDFELSPEYTLDMYKMAALSSYRDCKKAASEVVRLGDSPQLSGFMYPLLQALDEEYLDVDAQYGGVDQRKILMFARESLPKIGYKSRIEIMTPMIPGLTGQKMSSSELNSKIDLLDSADEVKAKLKKAYCEPGIVEDNGVLAFLKYVVFVLYEDQGKEFVIERPEKFGGPVSYKTYQELEDDYKEKKIHPLDLKMQLATVINEWLEPIRESFKGKEDLVKKAYPDE